MRSGFIIEFKTFQIVEMQIIDGILFETVNIIDLIENTSIGYIQDVRKISLLLFCI